jgi:hypothetical protein
MMADFPQDIIELRYFSDNWGPFSFNFGNLLPPGLNLSHIDLKVYVGDVNPASNLSEATEITDEIIDSDMLPLIDKNTVLVYFKYPTSGNLKGVKATLLFEFTLDTPARHVAYFQYVKIA